MTQLDTIGGEELSAATLTRDRTTLPASLAEQLRQLITEGELPAGLPGIKTMKFVPGEDANGKSSPDLDRSARYLYVYQTVNDRRTLKAVRSTSIRLILACP